MISDSLFDEIACFVHAEKRKRMTKPMTISTMTTTMKEIWRILGCTPMINSILSILKGEFW